MKYLIPLLALLTSAAAPSAAATPAATLSDSVVTAHAALPSVMLRNLSGRRVDAATLGNEGRPFLVSFWATWCKPCRRELSAISEVYDEWQRTTGVRLYAISIDEGPHADKVKPLVDSEGWDYDVLLDNNSELFRALGGTSVPLTLVVDGTGRIVERRLGYVDGGEEHLLTTLRQLTATP